MYSAERSSPLSHQEGRKNFTTMTRAIILLEGGAFRTFYSAGVLDVMMEHGLWLDLLGVSGGCLTGANYISHQPGRAREVNLAHRHDPDYVGSGALKREHSLIGFHYLFTDLSAIHPFDEDMFLHSSQKFITVATCCETGRTEYFDRDELSRDDVYNSLAASSSMPVLCPPVRIGNYTYLDGGVSDSIGLPYALKQGYERIIVVRTRDRSYRKPKETKQELALYKSRFRTKPLLYEDLAMISTRYNAMADELEKLEKEGRIFTIAPEKPVTASRLESDLKKLQDLYVEGRQETEKCWPALEEYLK